MLYRFVSDTTNNKSNTVDHFKTLRGK